MKSGAKQIAFWVLMLALLYMALSPGTYLLTRPHGDHAWAQCDRASWALNYYQFGYSFAEPRTHNIVYNPTGIATGEFPAIPYLVSKLYAVFGFHEYIFRIVTLLLSLPAFVVSFMLARKLLNSTIAILAASVLWLCSPNLIYYSTTFLPDTVALSFFVTAFWFIAGYTALSVKRLLLFSLLSSVAVLLKSSVLFLVAAAYISLLITNWNTPAFKSIFSRSFILSIPLIICMGWITFARHSQLTNHSNVFKLGLLLPHNLHEFITALYQFARNLPKLYPVTILALLPALVYLLISRFNRQNLLHVFTITGFIMWGLFLVLMMRNAGHHGYYHIPFQFLVCTLFVSALGTLPNLHTTNTTRLALCSIFIAVSLLLFTQTTRKITTHYTHINTAWLNLEPDLRKAGIGNRDKVFTAFDESYNISLYLLNQPGWNSMPAVWDYYKQDGLKACDYAVLTSHAINDTVITKQLGEKLFETDNVSVFRIKH
ncbi:MAG TPA: glycosyltransferase family 39 protein [Chitinophagales bacterium]|nr:glycosyltransferase family 39 protein [Chitinophagales bacterium]